MHKVYIGIDNGVSGALVAIGAEGGFLWGLPMPITKRGKSNMVDVSTIKNELYSFAMDKTATVLYEAPTKHALGKLSLCSTHECYGAVRAVLEILELRTHIITNPRTWQKEFWNTSSGYDTKAEGLRVARMLWPKETFLRTPRCKTPDTGIVDAALIAEYGRRKGL